MTPFRIAVTTAALVLSVAACSPASALGITPQAATATSPIVSTSAPEATMPPALDVSPPVPPATPEGSTAPVFAQLGYTCLTPGANHIASGQGSFPNVSYADVQLPGEPEWLVALPLPDGSSLWAVALTDGRVMSYTFADGALTSAPLEGQLAPGQPPSLVGIGGQVDLLTLPGVNDAPLSHPVRLPFDDRYLAIDPATAALLVLDAGQSLIASLPVDPLPDARIITVATDPPLAALLTEPTARYDHGIAGDDLEANALTLVELGDEPRVLWSVTPPDGKVIEGVMPMVAELNGDGEPELVVTSADASTGAELLVYSLAGELIGRSDAIGQGYRWRHQIAAGPLGPGMAFELVDVITPHIGGIPTWYRLVDGRLEVQAQLPGYTSHVIGTRNFDLAATADFDGDGAFELLIPRQDRQSLAALRRTADGAEEVWSLDLPGSARTNLIVIQLPGGRLQAGMATTDSILRVWGP